MMNPRKQKSQRTMIPQIPGDYMRGLQETSPTLPPKGTQKASKKSMRNDAAMFYRPQERSRSALYQESSAIANDYRALRRKFLELEEESCNLGNDLRVAEHEIRTLEDEKLELLDELVVLEGLVDPSELQN